MLRLPPERRHIFKKPFGRLYREIEEVLPFIQERKVYAVGDIVTKNLLARGIIPDLSVVDGLTMRVPCDHPTIPTSHTITVKNPPGTITEGLVQALREGIAQPPSQVIVEGEEDLAVIPLALSAPEGTAILYGQPCEGVVLRTVDQDSREEAKRLLAHFIRELPPDPTGI